TEIPITYPTEWRSRLTIAPEAKPGIVRWRLSCAQGGTVTRPFVIGELPEFLERESNSTYDTANRVKLPVTVNGRIHGERDLDHFRFSAKAGDVVVCEVLASRLMSRLDPVVEILDAGGRPLSTETVIVENDPVIAFRAPSTGDYVLRISNVSFRGDSAHVYRINISTQPFVRFVFPSGGRAGTTQTIEFQEMTGTPRSRIVPRRIAFPPLSKDNGIPKPFATAHRSETSVWFHAPTFVLTGHVNLTEFEPNDSRVTAMRVNVPATIHGRTGNANDRDWFTFRARKGRTYEIECAAGPGSAGYPTLLLRDANKKQFGFVRSIESMDRICRLSWRAKKDGPVLLRIRDQQFGAKGGNDFCYRLTVRHPQSDFQLSIGNEAFNVVQGEEIRIPVTVKRAGGFSATVTLSVEGLPHGVTAKTVTVKGTATSAVIVLRAEKNTACADAVLQIIGRAKNGGKTRIRKAVINAAYLNRRVDHLQLTVRHKPLFRLYCSEAYLYAYRGSVFMYPMEIERLNGFNGPITLQVGDRQNRDLDGIEMFEVTTSPGKSEILLPIYLPETMHINVQSQSQLYCQAYATFVDAHGKKQSVLVLSEKRNMLRTLPPVVKLNAVDERITGKPGETIRCRLKLQRTTNFSGAMTVRLMPSKQMAGIVAAEVRIPAGKTDAVMTLRLPPRLNSRASLPLTFRAMGKLTDGTTIITSAKVELRIRQ
ncbi:MAG: hypothetical protein IID45_10655, partial [Planctomycetes bacterium]|nr:hypothetical protein [Planctomycetota bacterium]